MFRRRSSGHIVLSLSVFAVMSACGMPVPPVEDVQAGGDAADLVQPPDALLDAQRMDVLVSEVATGDSATEDSLRADTGLDAALGDTAANDVHGADLVTVDVAMVDAQRSDVQGTDTVLMDVALTDSQVVDAQRVDVLALDAQRADAVLQDTVDSGPPPGTIYYPVTRHTVIQDVTMMELAPMVAIAGASYSITPALPTGLSFDTTTGGIGGRPTSIVPARDYQVLATAPSGTYARTLTLEVRSGVPSNLAYTTETPTYVLNTVIPTNAPAYVGSRVSFSVAPALPAGLRLGATTGFVTGTPTGPTGTSSHTITASNTYGTTTRTLRVTIAATAPRPELIAEVIPADAAPPLMFPGVHDPGPPLIGVGLQVPFPWFSDPCDLGSYGLTSDGTGLIMRLQDGCRWHQNYTTWYGYGRVELGLLRTLGGSSFPANVATTVEWRGYFSTALPPLGPRNSFVAPFQLHNNNGISPMFALGINVATQTLELELHRPDGSFDRAVAIAPFAMFLRTAHTLTMTIVPSNTATGSFELRLDGTVVFSLANAVTSNTPGEDYLKVGLYDWGKAIVDPAQPERGRSFEMVTERLRVTR